MLFADKSDSKKKMSLLSALINIQSSKVVYISASTGVLVKKTKDIEEVRLLLSKYPDAEVEVNRYPGHFEIIYWVDRHVSVSEGVKHPSWRTLSMWIEMTPIGEIINIHAEYGSSAMTEREQAILLNSLKLLIVLILIGRVSIMDSAVIE